MDHFPPCLGETWVTRKRQRGCHSCLSQGGDAKDGKNGVQMAWHLRGVLCLRTEYAFSQRRLFSQWPLELPGEIPFVETDPWLISLVLPLWARRSACVAACVTSPAEWALLLGGAATAHLGGDAICLVRQLPSRTLRPPTRAPFHRGRAPERGSAADSGSLPDAQPAGAALLHIARCTVAP